MLAKKLRANTIAANKLTVSRNFLQRDQAFGQNSNPNPSLAELPARSAWEAPKVILPR
jgi:hypothetical protein